MIDVAFPDMPEWLFSLLLVLITIMLAGNLLKQKSYYGIALLILVSRAAAMSAANSYQNSQAVIDFLNNDYIRLGIYLFCILLLVLELVEKDKEDSLIEQLRAEITRLHSLVDLLMRHQKISEPEEEGAEEERTDNDGQTESA